MVEIQSGQVGAHLHNQHRGGQHYANRVMPQMGQLPGSLRRICGCIGQL